MEHHVVQTDLTARLTLPIAVAIPVRNEEVLIPACIGALGRQIGTPVFDLVLLINNTTDGSAEAARRAATGLPLRLTILEHDFPLAEQTAGHARRLAMQAAAGLCGPGGILMCTDADGRVAPDWIAANLSQIRGGADAVAGRALLDPADAASIPAALHDADARECAYAAVLDRIATLVDPDPADPWPRHTEHSGASICVTWTAWDRAGGVPAVSIGEDRAFFQALRRMDARIRHAPDVCVTVSGRIAGRAAGGMADTIRRRMEALDPFVDDALEPALDCVRRLRLRDRLRHARADARLLPDLAGELGISMSWLADVAAARTFGVAWEMLERDCPSLVQRPVPTAGLEAELARAERILEGLLRADAPSQVLEAAD
jgi:hypothetical protein